MTADEERSGAGGGGHPGGEPGASLQVTASRLRDLREDRRLVTVVFADIVGSTALAERLDPEELRRILSSYFAVLAEEVRRYGGSIDKYAGDAVMAVFGAPAAHEDDVDRALRTSLAMVGAVKDLGDRLEMEHGLRLAVRVGANTGEVVAGLLDGAPEATYTVVGGTVNLAQRIQSAAVAGEILVGPTTYRLSRERFDYGGPRAITVKGRTEPLEVRRLLRPSDGATPVTADRGGALVGRASELAALRAAFGRVRRGEGGIVSVTGDPGVGKTRLLAEIRRDFSDDLRWLQARSLSVGPSIAYSPFIELIRGDAGIERSDGEDEARRKLETRVSELFGPDGDEVLPYLLTLVGLPMRGEVSTRLRYLDADAMRRQIFIAVRRYVAAVAGRGPLVLLFEDLHWCDVSSLTLLEHVLPLVRTTPLLVAIITRPDATAPAARIRALAAHEYADRSTQIVLDPLTAEESARLIGRLLDTRDVPARLVGPLVDKTGGNPLFLEAVVRSLVESRALVRDDGTGTWRLAEPDAALAIPDTVQGVLLARIDRLAEPARRTIKIAAVIGRTFAYELLRAVDPDPTLEENLAVLEDLDLVRPRRGGAGREYAFTHVLVQEAAYESLLVSRRRELHRAVGVASETLFAAHLDAHLAALADHFARAEDWPKAQAYLIRAGDQAEKVSGDAEALAHYRAAIAAYARAFGDRWDPAQRGMLERKIGEALFRRGDHRAGMDSLRRALTYLGAPYPRNRFGVRLAIARELFRQATHVVRGVGDETSARAPASIEERLRCYEVMAWIDYYEDNERLFLEALLLLNVSESSGFPLGVIQGSLGAGLVCDFIPWFSLAERYHRRGVRLADRLAHPMATGYAYMGLGYHEQRTGDWAASLEHWGRGARSFEEAGDRAKWGAASWGVVWILQRTGRVAEARRRAEDLIRVGRDAADAQLWGWGQYFLGRILWQSGATEEGVGLLRRAIELFESVPDYPNLVGASGDLGLCLLRQGKHDEALAVLERVERLMRERDIRGFLTHVYNALAEAHLADAERRSGDERVSALRRARAAIASAERRSRLEREGRVGAARSRGTYEWLTGRPAPARSFWSQSLAVATALGARYELATTHLEIGRRTGEPAHLDEARAIFAAVAAVDEVERIDALRTADRSARPRSETSATGAS